MLLDGSDSVGVHIALSRVYLNIGTHHQQWVRTHNPILGFRAQKSFALRDIAGNSLYWHATLIRIDPLAEFFKASTDPMRLKDAPLTPELRQSHLRGTGLPWYTAPAPPPQPADPKGEPEKKEPEKKAGEAPPSTDYANGRAVFAKGCIACHSSVQPGDLPELEAKISSGELPADRTTLRLREDDRWRLTRGDGSLPPGYAAWAREAVKHKEFWELPVAERDRDGNPVKNADGTDRAVTVHNYLSIDERLPVTMTRTNSGRAAATNALHGHVWEDFASQTYKELAPVGPVRYRDPFSGAEKEYSPPAGGPGYYRVPTLISIWATAPFLHNNALGAFNNDPSVPGRLAAFDDAIGRLLWPEKRAVPGTQVVWDSDQKAARTVYDGWYAGKRGKDNPLADADKTAAADRRAADGGWVWRTTEESWLRFDGPHVPMLFGGVIGLSPVGMRAAAWAPALAFLVLGVLLLLRTRVSGWLARYFSWLGWVARPVAWLLGAGGLALAAVTAVLVYRYWAWVGFLDAATEESIWGFRFVAVAAPVTFFASVGVLFALPWFPPGGYRNRVTRFWGVACLVLAVVVALGLGRFLAGRGAGVKVGPLPEGTPVNVLANFDPDAPRDVQLAAVRALMGFVQKHHGVPARDAAGKEAVREEFEARVAPGPDERPASARTSSPTGANDYEFIRRLTDDEKRELILLLKTF